MELECPICISPFDEKEVRPLVGICGHSMCESCLRPGISCSICRKEDTFRFRTVNYQLIELISKQAENLKIQEEMKKQLKNALAGNTNNTSDDEDDMEGYVICKICEEKTPEESARLCFDCSGMEPVLRHDMEELFCVTCWFGSEHSDHNTINYSEVKDEFLEMRGVFKENIESKQKCSALAELIRLKSADDSQLYGELFKNLIKMKMTSEKLQGRQKQMIKHLDDLRNMLFSFENYDTELREMLRKFRNHDQNPEIMRSLDETKLEDDECVSTEEQMVIFDDLRSDWVAYIVTPEETVESFATKIRIKHNIDVDKKMRLYAKGIVVANRKAAGYCISQFTLCTDIRLPFPSLSAMCNIDWTRMEIGTLASYRIEDLSKVCVVCDIFSEVESEKDSEENSEEDYRL